MAERLTNQRAKPYRVMRASSNGTRCHHRWLGPCFFSFAAGFCLFNKTKQNEFWYYNLVKGVFMGTYTKCMGLLISCTVNLAKLKEIEEKHEK